MDFRVSKELCALKKPDLDWAPPLFPLLLPFSHSVLAH